MKWMIGKMNLIILLILFVSMISSEWDFNIEGKIISDQKNRNLSDNIKSRMNNYFIDDEIPCLIDTNAEEHPITIIQRLKELGKELTDLHYVFISHLHYEHIGSLNFFKAQVPTCKIVTSPLNAEYLLHFEKHIRTLFDQRADEFFGIPGLKEFYYGLFSPIKSLTVDRIVRDGDVIPLGKHSLQILETPGHCAEEIIFYCPEKRILFASDFIVGNDFGTWIARNPILPNYGGDVKKYLESLNKISKLKDKIDLILPAHGEIIRNPKAKIDSLHEIALKLPNKILDFLRTGPKTVEELVELHARRKFGKTRKLYNISRLIQAQLNYLLGENKIKIEGNRYAIKK